MNGQQVQSHPTSIEKDTNNTTITLEKTESGIKIEQAPAKSLPFWGDMFLLSLRSIFVASFAPREINSQWFVPSLKFN